MVVEQWGLYPLFYELNPGSLSQINLVQELLLSRFVVGKEMCMQTLPLKLMGRRWLLNGFGWETPGVGKGCTVKPSRM